MSGTTNSISTSQPQGDTASLAGDVFKSLSALEGSQELLEDEELVEKLRSLINRLEVRRLAGFSDEPDEDTAAVVTALCERFTHLTDTIASDRLKPILAKPAEGLEDLAEREELIKLRRDFVQHMQSRAISSKLRSALEDENLVSKFWDEMEPLSLWEEIQVVVEGGDEVQDSITTLCDSFTVLGDDKTDPKLRSLLGELFKELVVRSQEIEAAKSLGIPRSALPSNIQRLLEVDTSSKLFPGILGQYVEDRELIERLGNLEDSAAEELAEFLDRSITIALSDRARVVTRGLTIRFLSSLCGSWGLPLPASYALQGEDEVTFSERLDGEEFCDIWRGSWGPKEVQVRAVNTLDAEVKERVLGMIVCWRYLRHENLLPLDGVCICIKIDGSEHTRTCLVSPWMKNGKILAFIGTDPSFNRFKLLADVCDGLIYLHSQGFVYGALNRDNVLVDDTERACLAPTQTFNSSHATPLEKSCDILDLGVLIFEVLAGKFENVECSDSRQPNELPPPRPNPEHSIWKLVDGCWECNPGIRPKLNEIRDSLKKYADQWNPREW